MKTNIYSLALLLSLSLAHAQNTAKDFSLSPGIAYVDTDKDGLVSLDEAYVVFDLYINNNDRQIQNDLTKDIESTIIELISYLEGVSCNDIKGSVASKRFIELYYVNKFNPKTDQNFGLNLGFSKIDTLTEKDLIIPVEKEQTAFFDKYISIGAQLTSITQQGFGIQTPKNDLEGSDPVTGNIETLVVLSVPIDFSPWKNGLFNFTPEYAGGNGMGNGAGFAGYPNALFGFPQTYPYLLRAQFQQKFFIHENENAFVKNMGITLGKFVLQEVFDCNPYSGDPKKDFMNFNHTMLSAWDAATTAYGYTYGGAYRINFKNSQFNFAAVTVDAEAGGIKPDWNIKEAYSLNAQYVKYFTIGENEGTFRALGFYNRALSGNFSNYTTDSLGGAAYFSDSLKAYNGKYGFGFDMNYELTKNLGFFARYSWNDGQSESMGYTQADRAYNVGLTYAFGKFGRPNDLFGISASANELSTGHRNFLADGGTGFMIGDGSLNYKREMVAEAFYRINLIRTLDVSINYQYIVNAAYNYDRGNAHFVACRLNFDF